jgi:uncharacterized protein YcnI
MLKKISLTALTVTLFMVLTVGTVNAHVVVQPGEVGVAARTDFSVGVPNEKDIPTTQVRLVIPEGLNGVTPYVKPGWRITMKKSDEGEEAKITEITWSGGAIGVGLRDAFVFRAQAPANETTLVWKAYQTYSDGSVVAWDLDPSAEEEEGVSGPYSETKVVKDPGSTDKKEQGSSDQTTTWVAYGALLAGLVGIALSLRRRA